MLYFTKKPKFVLIPKCHLERPEILPIHTDAISSRMLHHLLHLIREVLGSKKF